EHARYLDFANLRPYADQPGGMVAALVASASAGRPTANGARWAQPRGQALTLAQFVQYLGNDARQGRLYVPIDELQR
ncbi:squalene/phytoene synthase family protein, partial [Burkholderia pseudomallei]